MDKSLVFKNIEKDLFKKGFTFARKDLKKPWGGFWVIDENSAARFVDTYFPEIPVDQIFNGQKISPKILLVAPGKRLSWQYHFRRKEIWKVVDGKVGIVRSRSDEEPPMKIYEAGDTLSFDLKERHRLVGLDDWGIIAEIWMHTNPSWPSDEFDIVRLQDDFKRNTSV